MYTFRKFDVPTEKKIRVIISTDAKNEADDQYAICYALLSPKIEVVGIAAAHFAKKPADKSVEKSYQEILTVLEKMGLSGKIPVLMGAPEGIVNEHTARESEAARFIINEAHKDGKPLYIVNLGAITDLASAYMLDPSIGDRVEAAVWLGGGVYPSGGPEFNLMNDIPAANVIMRSKIPLWQIPMNASICIRVGFAELIRKVYPCGEIGKYLVDQLIETSVQNEWSHGESWILWDMAGIAVLLDPHMLQYHMENAPLFNEDMFYIPHDTERKIRVYDRIEPRYVMEDFFAKIELGYGNFSDAGQT